MFLSKALFYLMFLRYKTPVAPFLHHVCFYCESQSRNSLALLHLDPVLAALGFRVAAGEIWEIWDIRERGVGENRD